VAPVRTRHDDTARMDSEGVIRAGQFRWAYFPPRDEATVAWEFPIREPWDRHPDDRGTLLQAASGIVAVLAFPSRGASSHLWEARPPRARSG
jgi:hypothetical protein